MSEITVLPAKSDSDFMFCLQHYQGLIIDRSLVYLGHMLPGQIFLSLTIKHLQVTIDVIT